MRGKNWKDFSKWTLVSEADEQTVYSSVLHAPALKKDIRVVCIIWQVNSQIRREVLFSTNLEMPALEVIECYRARFEMEFPFRDAKRPKPVRCCRGAKKQFAGLMDSQSRSEKALEFAWNASFLTVSLARAQQLLAFEGDVTDFVFSMEDSKRRAYNELFADRIIRLLPVGLSLDKCLALIENALNLGVKAA